MSSKIGIVGAGIAGVATAIRLAQKGYSVTVFEKNNYPGGKLTAFEEGGFRFDAGPSLFTMPGFVDELFTLCGKNPSDNFPYHKLEVLTHYFYEDGTTLKAYADKERLVAELNEKLGENPDDIRRALKKSKSLHELLSDLFIHRSLHDWRTFVNKKALKAYANLGKLDFFRTMHQANTSLFTNPKTVQLFNRYATYNGSDPYQTPATMNIIPHLEFGIGAYLPKSGMHQITESLVNLAEEMGVHFRYNAGVEEILTTANKATGLKVNGEKLAFDYVVSNMDLVGTYRRLLPGIKAPKKLLEQPKSSSALIFYWGLEKTFPQLDLHNIFFSANYEEEFRHIFKEKTIYHDPTVYVNITSKYVPEDAPEGAENWFTMINVPNNTGQNWKALIAEAKKHVIDKLSRSLRTDITPYITVEKILDPILIEQKTSSYQGALYGNSSNNKYAAFLRHPNKSSSIRNLYFCGGSVHPGGGIPLCLSSAKIVSNYFSPV